MNIKDLDVKRLNLNEGDVLLVRVPRKNMPSTKWVDYANNIKDSLQVFFLTNKVIVIDSEIEILVVTQKEQQNEL